jgi:hypothetical protein
MVNLQAGKLRGTVAMSAPSRNHKANRHGMGGGASYGLGRRDPVAPSGIIDGKPLEPDESRKERQRGL